MKYNVWIKWELSTIRYLFETVLPHLHDLATVAQSEDSSHFNEDGTFTKFSLALGAREMTLDAVMYELNALVEYMLLAFAGSALPSEERLTPEALRKSRKSLAATVGQYYEVDLSKLPGYSLVEELREEVNALKHRGGLLMPQPTPMGIPIIQRVEKNQHKVESYLTATEQFLLGLCERVQSQSAVDEEAEPHEHNAPRAED